MLFLQEKGEMQDYKDYRDKNDYNDFKWPGEKFIRIVIIANIDQGKAK